MIDKRKHRQHKKQGEENKQNRREENNFKIVQAIAFHFGIGKKMMMLQRVAFKNSL